MNAAYLDEFDRVGRLAFSMWNRDPASPSFGSFDRQYWGWKFKDFSDATLQYAVILACEYARRTGATGSLPALLEGFVDFCASIQHADGSFDQCYPHERTPGVIYDMLPALTYVRRSPWLASPASRERLDAIVEGAVTFALRTDERHGEVANHIAEYAWELLAFAQQTGHDAARRRGEAYLERLLGLFDREEGWFLEYSGADAGYQSRCLRYFTKIAALRDDSGLWRIAEQAAGFVAMLIMPDHSLSPVLGCRATALLYPSSFETLAQRSPALRCAARSVREAWRLRRVPMPSEIDFGNAIRLAHDAMEAGDAAGDLGNAEPPPPPPALYLPRAGMAIYSGPRLRAWVATRLGGACCVYARDGAGWRLARESAGYLLQSGDRQQSWVTWSGAGEAGECNSDGCRVNVPFVRSLHDELTPRRMVLLRILNLTVLRVQWLADLFRRIVVRRLISGVQTLPLRLERTIAVAPDTITVKDFLHGHAPVRDFRLIACRRVTGVHMASARYFQSTELDGTWITEVAWDGNSGLVASERLVARVD